MIRGGVRRQEARGEEFLVAPISFLKPMDLHKGYVPRRHVEESAPKWNGIPILQDHPTDSKDNFISANAAPHMWTGFVFNTRWDTEFVSGEAWLSVNDTPTTIIRDAENGEPVSVSAAYGGDQLDPGVYDGQYREKVKGNLEPDHVAALLDREGRCSIENGCRIG